MTLKPALLATAILLAAATATFADDVSGTYSWTAGGMGGGGGGGNNETTLVLKQDGDKLTGTISGRGGDTAIEDGSVDGKAIKFKVVRDFNGNKFVTEYAGTVDGDTIKLKITSTREVEAKKKA
jgi:hypothetical protein